MNSLQKISDLFLAGALEESPKTETPKRSRDGLSPHQEHNMRKHGCKTLEEYKEHIKKRKRNEKLYRKIKRRNNIMARIEGPLKTKFAKNSSQKKKQDTK